MKKLSLILISLLVSFVPTFGIADYFEVTEIGSSAQSIRIGNIEGFSSFSNSIFENPAGLYRLNKVSGTLFTSKLMNEVNYLNGSIAYRFKFGVLAFGYFDASVSGIPFTEEVFYDDTSEFEATSYFNSTNSLTAPFPPLLSSFIIPGIDLICLSELDGHAANPTLSKSSLQLISSPI